MRSRDLIYSEDARAQLKVGIDALANMVKVTLGPMGRNVVIDRSFGRSSITKDGVSVAREVFLSDIVANQGAQLVKEVASKNNDDAGDGTTTATVLAQAIISEGMKHLSAGVNPMELKRGIDKATKLLVDKLKEGARDVKSKEDIIQIGTISANNEESIGKLIAEAMDAVGNGGTITVEDGTGMDTSYEVVEGMQFDRGYKSPYFVNTDDRECIMDNATILLVNEKLNDVQVVTNVMTLASSLKKPLLVVANDFSPDVLKLLVVNNARGTLVSCAVLSPAFGDRRRDILDDIAAITGATVFAGEVGNVLSTMNTDDFGSCEKSVTSENLTIIVGGSGEGAEAIKDRINTIKNQITNNDTAYDKIRLEERLARLTGGVAILRIGATTEMELKEKKDRVEDALHATRAAAAEGIVEGGGIALLRARHVLQSPVEGSSDRLLEQALGFSLMYKAVEVPFRAILENAGEKPDVILDKVMRESKGYDVLNRKYGDDMFKLGVIDPLRVTRMALENAASIAGLFLTTEGLIISTEEERAFNERMLENSHRN